MSNNIRQNQGGYPQLLTASVDTRGMKGAKFSSEEREKMYVDTLNYYISLFTKNKTYQEIIFVENSGWDLNRFREKIHESNFISVEYQSLDPSIFNQTKGKSYNELLLIQIAITKSEFIQDAKCFVKLTGRFPIANLDKILLELQKRGGKRLEFFGDCKDHKVYDWLRMPINGHSGESRFYFMTLDFWNKYFADCYMKLNDYDGDNIEKFLLQLKRKTYGEKNVIWRLRVQPHFTGKGGHNLGYGPAFFYSTDQDSSVLRFKRSIRQLLRWSAPWWWC